MKNRIVSIIARALPEVMAEARLDPLPLPPVEVEATRDPAHGDYATNLAMILSARLKRNPRQIARTICDRLQDEESILAKVEIAGPGFINFFLREEVWKTELQRIEAMGERYGCSDAGGGRRVQVEFVSANPTGPLHIGHARGAVVGDVLANILRAAGYEVYREYYVNDAGNQMFNLGRSVLYRYRELLGRLAAFPETCYQGEYIRAIAAEILSRDGESYLDRPEEEVVPVFTDYAATVILRGIKEDLAAFGVVFDGYFSERELYRDDGVAKLLRRLEEGGHIYGEDGARWFRTTAFGDEKDRVVVRQNGETTYFAADIAYHKNKFERGFSWVIDVWGADHHGYLPRMSAGVQALGYPPESLRVVLVQLVNLLRGGKPVAMSTRSGEFVTLREVVDEVGRDAARYNFLMRRTDSHLDFDLEVAKEQSNENPVYYVQYAHARIAGILRLAAERGMEVPRYEEVETGLLVLSEEMALIKALSRFPELVAGAAAALEPHRLTFFANELAALFHSYYNKYKVISDDPALSRARLFLIEALRIVLKNNLHLLGVSAPDRM
ncbi:MAG: arginine--tRNA ligase [Pseudomonadota bacterium]|nr:arginine--tRNA ligase [Pseudomonadota bacterium]